MVSRLPFPFLPNHCEVVFDGCICLIIVRGLLESFRNIFLEFQNYQCEPRPKVVELPISHKGAYWPACTEILQCGGCCGHLQFKECKPIKLENKTTTVVLIPYDGKRIYLHERNVEMYVMQMWKMLTLANINMCYMFYNTPACCFSLFMRFRPSS